VKGTRGRRLKQRLHVIKEMKGYWKSEEEALDRMVWGTRCGRAYGPVLRQTTD
jgi:hypothetical protein